jgi:hypothetical protein
VLEQPSLFSHLVYTTPPLTHTTRVRLQDDYGIYEYSEWYTRLCKEHGVTRDFVVKKAAPKKE